MNPWYGSERAGVRWELGIVIFSREGTAHFKLPLIGRYNLRLTCNYLLTDWRVEHLAARLIRSPDIELRIIYISERPPGNTLFPQPHAGRRTSAD